MRRALALLAACAVSFGTAAGWVKIPLDANPVVITGVRSGCVAPGQYERAITPVPVAASSVTIEGLPDSGRCYFAPNVGPQDELVADFTALKFGRAPPGPVGNVVVTWAPTPPIAASVTVSNINGFVEFDLVLVGTVDFRMTSPSDQEFDYCTGASPSPVLGTNNDGVVAQTVTIRGPATARCDFDGGGTAGTTFKGMTVMVSGVSKPLVQSGSTWRATW